MIPVNLPVTVSVTGGITMVIFTTPMRRRFWYYAMVVGATTPATISLNKISKPWPMKSVLKFGLRIIRRIVRSITRLNIACFRM